MFYETATNTWEMWTTLTCCLCFLDFSNVIRDYKHMIVALEYVHVKHRMKLLSVLADLIQQEPWALSLYSWNYVILSILIKSGQL